MNNPLFRVASSRPYLSWNKMDIPIEPVLSAAPIREGLDTVDNKNNNRLLSLTADHPQGSIVKNSIWRLRNSFIG